MSTGLPIPTATRLRRHAAVKAATPARPADETMNGVRQVSVPVYLSMMFVVSVYSGALTPAVRWATGAGPLPPGSTDIGSTLTQFFALFVVTVWGVRNIRRMPGMPWGLLPYLLILVLCFMSILWSNYPFISLRRSVTITVCVFYGVYLLDRLGLEGAIRLFVYTASCLALLSIVAYVAVPTVGRDTAEGYSNAMRGVFAAKNTAGMAMLLALPCALFLGSRPGAKRAAWVGVLMLLVVTLGATRSATSMLIALIVIGLGSRLWLRGSSGRLLWTAAVMAVAITVAFTLVFWPDQIFPLIGRDSSLTGRVPLWEECFKMIVQRPLLGYGYSGFWNSDSRDVQYLWRIIGWEAPNGHDGYIDILLQIGAIGLFLYMTMWGSILVRAARHVRNGTLPEAAWMLLFMTVNVLLNIDEGPLPYPDEFTLYVAMSIVVLWRTPHRRPIRPPVIPIARLAAARQSG